MSLRPIIVKLGGDALASPERIVAQARRLSRWAAHGPVVAVASARRGVTDHLLELVAEVANHTGKESAHRLPDRRAAAEADRAVASGEVVAASLLALALNQLGTPASSLDAREAGVSSRGRFGSARITAVAPRRLQRLLARGVVPVVTGFQGWQKGRVATLGRGGTDTSAVALAVALEGESVRFVKDAPGLRTADPKLVSDSVCIAQAPHAFLSALTASGSRVIRAEAAALAERHGFPLEFWALDGETAVSRICRGTSGTGLRAVATGPMGLTAASVTVIAGDCADLAAEADPLRTALNGAGVDLTEVQPAANGLRFVVPSGSVAEATRALHDAFVRGCSSSRALRAS
jgi:aspartate kinase